MIHRISGLLMPESIEECITISCHDCAFGFPKGEGVPMRRDDLGCRNIWGEL